MAAPVAPNGRETEIRAIVFRDGDVYVGQCLEYDIAAQAKDLSALLDRLELTVEAEFATCAALKRETKNCISPAPVYYHNLWDSASLTLQRVNVSTPLNYRMAKAA